MSVNASESEREGVKASESIWANESAEGKWKRGQMIAYETESKWERVKAAKSVREHRIWMWSGPNAKSIVETVMLEEHN